MTKYYTLACNFYYGKNAKALIKKKLALPLCGNVNQAFDKIEILSRKRNKVSSKILNISRSLSSQLKKKKRSKTNNKKRNNF